MKEIKGKISFKVYEWKGDYEHKKRLVTAACNNLDGTKNEGYLLSEMTEEQASEFVELERRSKGRRMGKTQCGFYALTAKQSLISLLKANGCLSKEMWGEYCEHLPLLRESRMEQLPDDLLLIKL